MEGGVEAGDLRHSRRHVEAVRIGARLCGWCSGASGRSFGELAPKPALVTITGRSKCTPP